MRMFLLEGCSSAKASRPLMSLFLISVETLTSKAMMEGPDIMKLTSRLVLVRQ